MSDVTARIRSRIEVDFRIYIWIWIRNHIESNMDPKHRYFPSKDKSICRTRCYTVLL
jgi:hypothetical protein